MNSMRSKHLSKSKPRQWPNVYSRTHRGGQVGYVVDFGLVNGKRERHSFKTRGKADSYAELKRTERKNQGARALMLSNKTRQDAIKAEGVLKKHGVSMARAAQYYFDHVTRKPLLLHSLFRWQINQTPLENPKNGSEAAQ